MAAILSRLFVGLEAGLGFLFIFNLYGTRKWVLRISFFLLLVFTIYLVYLLLVWGNQVNCGCFGDSVFMSPTASIFKNLLMLVLISVLNRWHSGVSFNRDKWVAAGLLVAGCSTPFVMFGLPVVQPEWIMKRGYTLHMEHLYTKGQPTVPDWAHGKKVIGFYSQGCNHCRNAAYKMHLMREQDTTLPFLMVIALKNDLGPFFEKTGTRDIPYMRMPPEDFVAATGGIYPMIVFVNNGQVEAKVDFEDLTPAMIRKWLNQPK